MLAWLVASCVTPPDAPFREAFAPNTTAADIANRLRERLVERFPPGEGRVADAVRYLTEAGAECEVGGDGVHRCTYSLLRPTGAAGEGPLDDQEFVDFDIDLVPEGELIDDIEVAVD